MNINSKVTIKNMALFQERKKEKKKKRKKGWLPCKNPMTIPF